MNKTNTLIKSLISTKGINFTLYIGLKDKVTFKPMNISKAKAIIKDVCLKYVKGCTIYFGDGWWINPKTNKIEDEKVLICILNNTDRNTVNKIVDKLLVLFNQECILIQPSGLFCRYSKSK